MIGKGTYVILAFGFLCLVCQITDASTQDSDCKEHDALTMILDELALLREQYVEQKTLTTAQEATIHKLTAKINEHDAINEQLKVTNSKQDVMIERLTAKVKAQEILLEQGFGLNGAKAVEKTHKAGVRDQHQALGCVADTLDLSCSNGGIITVTQAYLGQYLQSTECSEGCCAPNPGADCTETLEENEPAEWVYLKYLCDNKTECTYEYNGEVINECEMEYVADYMLIYYSCQPYNENDYVAFTALATESRYYDSSDIILFDYAITNIGNHYNAATSNFVCPFHGVYSFSISFYAGIEGNLFLNVMRDDELIISGFADDEPNDAPNLRTHGMSAVVIECNVGQLVWASCGSDNNDFMYSGSTITSHFTGFLLHRLS